MRGRRREMEEDGWERLHQPDARALRDQSELRPPPLRRGERRRPRASRHRRRHRRRRGRRHRWGHGRGHGRRHERRHGRASARDARPRWPRAEEAAVAAGEEGGGGGGDLAQSRQHLRLISAVGARRHGGLPPLEERARRGEGVGRSGDREEIGEALAELGEDVALQPARVVAVVEGEAHLGGRKSGVRWCEA